MSLTILSGGAAQGLVAALAPQFKAETGADIDGSFGAVGAMRDKLLAGAPADMLILTASLIAELTQAGRIVKGSAADLGAVATGVAVRAGDPAPAIGDADALRAALRAADGIYFPDPNLATAGIHFAKVLERLGIADEVADRLRVFPNGAAAMRALADVKGGRPIGCTQATEILNTPGITLVGNLPRDFALATVYRLGITTQARSPDLARRFAALLTSAATRDLRQRLGFGV
ncbi:MAG TPA: substrate-binding domain-containing protein [Xanthobacteraceae bacterium]|jgi:molybdate transport system substrate-binding protein|nr:substrate-binding domain-containing protein [Xanthobacteraceae bacterium]